MTARPYQARPMREHRYTWGPARRLHDRGQTAGAPEDAAGLSQNMWIRDADTETAIAEGRPGFVQAGAQLGGVGARAGQRVYQFSKADGTETTVAIVGGKFYTYNHSTDTWTEVLDSTDFSGASITLSATAKVFCCTFANQLIVTDGVNTPWAWNGTAHGGLTKLTNAPVAYGAPWVYYAKLFFIKNTEKTTIVWSEEALPNTGYEAGGYNNAWQLRQTGSEGFVAGAATNSQLYLFRPNSYTLITGAVTTDFQSTGVRDGNERVGCRSPAGVLVIGEDVYFLSGDRRIMRARGIEAEEIATGARATLAQINTAKLDRVECALGDFGSQGFRLLWGVPETGITEPSAFVCVNPLTGRAESIWRGWYATALGTIKNANGDRRVMHLGGSTATTVDEGYAYLHDVPTGTSVNDALNAVPTSPINHILETTALGTSPTVDQGFLRVDVVFRPVTNLTQIALTVTTSKGAWMPATPLAVSLGAGVTTWNGSTWNGGTWTEGGTGERHIAAGLRNVAGRWAKIKLGHGVAGERFAVSEVSVVAVPMDERPGAH